MIPNRLPDFDFGLGETADLLREIVRKEGASFVRAGFVNFGASSLDFELEFGCYIGTPGKDITRENARQHIFGYTIFNDFSARDEQTLDMAGQLDGGVPQLVGGGIACGLGGRTGQGSALFLASLVGLVAVVTVRRRRR